MTATFVVGQNPYWVSRGSVHEYKVEKTEFAASYSWQIYTDKNYEFPASAEQVGLISLGAGRENEIRVKWNVSGDYYLMVYVSSAEGCTNREAWNFVVTQTEYKPIALISGPSQVTLGACDTNGYVLDASSSIGGGLAFSWLPTIFLDNAESSKTKFMPGETTRYLLTVTDSLGQSDTTSVLITVEKMPKVVTDRNVFVKTASASILLNGGNSTGTGLAYLWQSNDGDILNGETTAVAEVRGIGIYYLKITDSYGCTGIDSVEVGLYTQAVKDTAETKLNFTVDINVLANDIPKGKLNPATLKIVTAPKNGMATVVGDSLVSYLPNQYFVGSDDFVYSICDYFQHCDQATVLVMVNDVPFFIPEAFSPNGDGINDRFEIKGLQKYKTVEIQIFNRWGNIVYQSNNYGVGDGKKGFWDGIGQSRAGGNTGPVPAGTYYYVLKAAGSKNISGSIYLDR